MAAEHADRILLIGMMGAGKTSVGRALAARLGRPFLDNDALVLARTGREPADIDATDERVAQVIKAAVQEAKDAPFPDPLTAFTDVWADGGSAWRN